MNLEPKANFLNMNLLNPWVNIPNQNLLAKQITVIGKTYKKNEVPASRKMDFLKGTIQAWTVNYKLLRILFSS